MNPNSVYEKLVKVGTEWADAEQALRALNCFEPHDDVLWITHLDAEDVDKAIDELRQAIAESKGE